MTSKAVNITKNKAAKFNKKKYEKERKQKRLKKAINVFLSLQDIQYWFDCVVGLSFALVTTIMGGVGYGFKGKLGPYFKGIRNCRKKQPEAELPMAENGRVRPSVAAAAAALQRNATGNNPFIY